MKTVFIVSIRDAAGQMHVVNVLADTDEQAKAHARNKLGLPADAKVYGVNTHAENVEVA
jgi:hypothetical protein